MFINNVMKVYWIKLKTHNDIYSQGYVGITNTDGRHSRIKNHFRKLKNNSHPNPLLQNVYNKQKDDIVFEILFEGSVDDCIEKEILFRPNKNIGWNILEGGGLPPNNIGKSWYNNGIKNVLSFDCPFGFQKGKIQKKGIEHKFYGKKKLYEVKGKFEKGRIPWNKGISCNLGEKPKIMCPHCKKIGGLPQMKQWHF